MYGIGFEEDGPRATQFKIGQRVRVVKGIFSLALKPGDIGYVNGVFEKSVVRATFFGGIDRYLVSSCIEPAPFTRGDSVRLTRDYGSYKKGHQGTVTIDNDENVGVLMDIGRYASFPHDVLETFERGAVNDNAPALGSSKPTPHIVARVEHGQPLPAYRPHVHTGEAAAVTEAERLARANPGKQFDVWRRVTGRVAEQHVELKEVA